ncbi:hypothetical protein OKJ48_05430 [Streptomyces kunmingensis]|uniref:Integral membrane protein n=1 Tax=Streptomyces kunmingensis TaxID=68225 RepID=A0ABU6C4Q1_9ACTN|nr:hypothetical protein [Streptomyces kunmingensis]MEB3959692.1 hypothetical protein [Streptomyces kunmingensis]
MRALACAVLAAELGLAGCLVAGVRLPWFVEATVLLVVAVEVALLLVTYRRGGRAALQDVLPAGARQIVGNELRVFGSLGLWAARRRHGVPPGADSFSYARGQATMMYAFAFVCVVETFGMSVLLRDWPTAHRIVLILDVYTVLMVLGLHAASVTRPHVITADALRVRRGSHVDLRIPLERIASVRRENRFTHTASKGELNLDVAAQTSITLELDEPVRHLTFLGRPKEVHRVRLHAEEPDLLARTLEVRLTQARTGPSPVPELPG